jgi:hypothetical protein
MPSMSGRAWREVSIGKQYDRDAFDCGEDALNEFLRRHARKSHECGGSKTFLAIDETDGKTVLGYYTLSPASLTYERTPESVRKDLARHDVPVFRLGRLAVDRSAQAAEVGGVALRIDAKNERAAKWYGSYGAVTLLDAPLSLLLPLRTIEAAIEVDDRNL